jgi:hypothetical protein
MSLVLFSKYTEDPVFGKFGLHRVRITTAVADSFNVPQVASPTGVCVEGETLSDTFATATVSVDTDDNATDADTLVIAGTTYTWEISGSVATANEILLGANAAASMATLVNIINGTGTINTEYVAGTLTPHPAVRALAPVVSGDNTVVTLVARTPGSFGNSITLTESGTSMTVSGATLSGGVGGRVAMDLDSNGKYTVVSLFGFSIGDEVNVFTYHGSAGGLNYSAEG